MQKTKKRCWNQLTLEDRVKIEIKYQEGMSFRDIAEYLGNSRTASSICREVSGKPRRGLGKYQAHIAHGKALDRRFSKKPDRLKNEIIRAYVKEKMKLGWSPEQISIRLPIDLPGNKISHEAVYQFVYAQIRRSGNGKVRDGCEDLRSYLPRRHGRRQMKGFRQAQKAERPVLPSIENRPAIVSKRIRIGDWEDYTMVSRQSTDRLKTINERVSGIVLIGKMRDGSIIESNRVVYERLGVMPKRIRKTLTRDRGIENLGYQELETNLHISCYFARAYCSQDRGSNENVNGLIRRFFPKKTDFSKVSKEEIMRTEYLLNTRPRKRHGGKNPLEVLLERTGVAITY
ncbi:MAG: IS30 family transposase [Candidatus Levybacteria bacterium]|nr:IS30 family transposase [Candidatus Levybacteria bacterium]